MPKEIAYLTSILFPKARKKTRDFLRKIGE